jgi:hypothetical protein
LTLCSLAKFYFFSIFTAQVDVEEAVPAIPLKESAPKATAVKVTASEVSSFA